MFLDALKYLGRACFSVAAGIVFALAFILTTQVTDRRKCLEQGSMVYLAPVSVGKGDVMLTPQIVPYCARYADRK